VPVNKRALYLASLIATTVFTVTACNSDDSSPSNAASTPAATTQAAQLSDVKNIVVIYAENHSLDDVYGNFPGANGLQNATASSTIQLDRNGMEG
jgi:phospholipase C